MPTVEFLYDRDCPNVVQARTHLLMAFAQVGLSPQWSEYLVGHPDAPPHTRGYGSPTILIDGRDVSPAVHGANASCRLYASDDGSLSRVPAIAEITAAFGTASRAHASKRLVTPWRSGMATAPAIGAALLPIGVCPVCWPAYAGLLSSVGLSFLMETRWLIPLTAVLLAVAVGALGFRARSRHGYGPFGVGIPAAAIVLSAKFAIASDAAMYAGVGLLVIASAWNVWPRQGRVKRCPTCASSD